MTSKTEHDESSDVNAAPDVDAETRAAERMRMIELAKAEHAAVKLWKQNGEDGDRPLTPTLDEMDERYIAAGCAPGSSAPKRRSATTNGVPTRRGADDDAVIAFAVAARKENPAIKRLQILRDLRQSGMSCSRERLYPLLDKLDAETQQSGPSEADVAAAVKQLEAELSSPEFAAALDSVDEILDGVAAANPQGPTARKLAKSTAQADMPKLARRRSAVLDEIKKPHTAAELCAIAAANNVAGVRPKMGKGEIIERIEAAIVARTKRSA